MSHDLLCDASDQHVFKSRQAMGWCDDKIDIVPSGETSDLLNRQPSADCGFKFYATEFHRSDERAHLSFGIFARRVLQGGKIVQRKAISCVCIPEMNRV